MSSLDLRKWQWLLLGMRHWAVTEKEGISMTISVSQLMANCPLTEEYEQVAELAGSVAKLSMQKVAEIVASFPKANVEPPYSPPPIIPLPMQRQPTTIVITLTID